MPLGSHSTTSSNPNPSHGWALIHSVFIVVPFLDISYNQTSRIYGLCSWLLSLSIIFSRSNHVAIHISINFFFLPNTVTYDLSGWQQQLRDVWIVPTFWLVKPMFFVNIRAFFAAYTHGFTSLCASHKWNCWITWLVLCFTSQKTYYYYLEEIAT